MKGDPFYKTIECTGRAAMSYILMLLTSAISSSPTSVALGVVFGCVGIVFCVRGLYYAARFFLQGFKQ